MAPSGLMMLAFAPVSGRLIASVGAKHTLILGATVLAVGYLVGLFLMDAPWQLLVAACIASAGVGIGYAAMPTLILDAVPAPRGGLRRRPQRADALGRHDLRRRGDGHDPDEQHDAVRRTLAVPSAGAFQACFAVGAAAALLGALDHAPRCRAAELATADERHGAALRGRRLAPDLVRLTRRTSAEFLGLEVSYRASRRSWRW